MAAGGVIAYEDIFEILDQDADGKRFDRVSRFRCRSAFESDLQIDINIDIYKLEVRPRVDHPRGARGLHPPSRLDAEVDNCGPFAHPRLSPPSASSPQIGTKFTLVLAPTLSLDGTPKIRVRPERQGEPRGFVRVRHVREGFQETRRERGRDRDRW